MPRSRSGGRRTPFHRTVMLRIRGAQAEALCKLRKLHKCRVVLVLSLPQLTPAPTVSVSPLPDIKDRESLVLCSTHPPGSGVAPWVPQAPVHGHGLVRFSTVSAVHALELGGAPWAPPRWQGEGCCPEASFLGDGSLGRGEECQPREFRERGISLCGSYSQCGLGPPPTPGFWRLKPPGRLPESQLGLGGPGS